MISYRIGAYWIDGLLFAPLIYVLESQTQSSFMAEAGSYYLSLLLFTGYRILCHRYFGQTLGKYICSLRVEGMKGQAIRWREALLRSSVDSAFVIILTLVLCFALFFGHDITDFSSSGWIKRIEYLETVSVFWIALTQSLRFVWYCSNMGVTCFHKHHRSLEDLIADTIVRSDIRPLVNL